MNGIHRVWAVRWTAEDLRPFAMFEDRGFLMIAKCGRPGFYVPSPTTVSRDVKAVFVSTRRRLARMLQVSTLSFHILTRLLLSTHHNTP